MKRFAEMNNIADDSRDVLFNIHTNFEFSRCLVYPTFEINICSILLIKKPYKQASKVTFPIVEDSPTT